MGEPSNSWMKRNSIVFSKTNKPSKRKAWESNTAPWRCVPRNGPKMSESKGPCVSYQLAKYQNQNQTRMAMGTQKKRTEHYAQCMRWPITCRTKPKRSNPTYHQIHPTRPKNFPSKIWAVPHLISWQPPLATHPQKSKSQNVPHPRLSYPPLNQHPRPRPHHHTTTTT